MTKPILAAAAAFAFVLTPVAAFAQHPGGGGSKMGTPSSPGGMSPAQEEAREAARAAEQSGGAHYRLGGSSEMSVNVGERRKAEIREKLLPVAANRMVSHQSLEGVALTPGVRAPREKLRIRRLPAEIVSIAPEYSNYEYFVVDDGVVVIVDPRSYEIVDVLPG